ILNLWSISRGKTENRRSSPGGVGSVQQTYCHRFTAGIAGKQRPPFLARGKQPLQTGVHILRRCRVNSSPKAFRLEEEIAEPRRSLLSAGSHLQKEGRTGTKALDDGLAVRPRESRNDCCHGGRAAQTVQTGLVSAVDCRLKQRQISVA